VREIRDVIREKVEALLKDMQAQSLLEAGAGARR
jgi:hypothetical protein